MAWISRQCRTEARGDASERVEKLVSSTLRRLMRFPRATSSRCSAALQSLPSAPPAHPGAAPLIEGVLKGSVADPDTHMPVKLIARYLAPFVGKDGVSHLLTLASSIRKEDMEEVDLRTIHVPALVLWGEKDQWLDTKLADKLVNALPDGRLVRLPAVGRLVPEESPERLNELLLDFMKKRAVA